MSRNETVLQVFVASPSDVEAERRALDQVVAELNAIWVRSIGLRLELLKWENLAYPGFGEDPQAVINEALPDAYDAFVGILWARFGTPTRRAESGTAEEFQRALDQYKSSPESVRIMMYFKDAPIAPSRIDVAQLAKVQEFKERVPDEGGLYWAFSELSQFEGLLRLHLSQFVQGWQQKHASDSSLGRSSAGSAAPNDSLAEKTTGSEELGFLDLIEEATSSLISATEVSDRITHALGDLAANVTRRASEVADANNGEDAAKLRLMKRAANHTADDMQQFARRVRDDAPLLAQYYEESIKSTGTAASLALDFEGDPEVPRQLTKLAEILEASARGFEEAVVSMQGLHGIVSSLPRMTTALNRAKRSTIEVLGTLIRQFESSASLSWQAAKTIRNLLADPPIQVGG
jgi:hypothetical protein